LRDANSNFKINEDMADSALPHLEVECPTSATSELPTFLFRYFLKSTTLKLLISLVNLNLFIAQIVTCYMIENWQCKGFSHGGSIVLPSSSMQIPV
jgi:hypothetical protein